MESHVQKKLKDYLENTGISVAELERNAGLKINVARNILRGQSKRPTGATLQAIAAVMGCTVQDLLPERDESSRGGKTLPERTRIVEHPELLNEVFQCILRVTKDNNYKLTLQQTSLLLEEIYCYSIQRDPPQIDVNFIEWFIKRTVG